jgi:hypothetical protein
VREREVPLSSTGHGSPNYFVPRILNQLVGTRFKVITGYSGAAHTFLAVERGETEGRCTTVGSISAMQPQALKQRTLNIIVHIGPAKRTDLADVPFALDLAKTEADRDLLRLLVAPLAIASAFALPPDVPAERVAIWRKAFAATLQDAQFRKDAAKISFEVTERSGPEVEEIVRIIYATPAPVIERARRIFALPR